MASKQQSDMDKGKDKGNHLRSLRCFVFDGWVLAHSLMPWLWAGAGFTETRPDLLLALEEHFFYHFRISLSAFVLCRISTPLAHVSTEGKIKVLPPTSTSAVVYDHLNLFLPSIPFRSLPPCIYIVVSRRHPAGASEVEFVRPGVI